MLWEGTPDLGTSIHCRKYYINGGPNVGDLVCPTLYLTNLERNGSSAAFIEVPILQYYPMLLLQQPIHHLEFALT